MEPCKPEVESLQSLSKSLAKQNDMEILEDRIQKAPKQC